MTIIDKSNERPVDGYRDLVWTDSAERVSGMLANLLEILVERAVLTEQEVIDITWARAHFEVAPAPPKPAA